MFRRLVFLVAVLIISPCLAMQQISPHQTVVESVSSIENFAKIINEYVRAHPDKANDIVVFFDIDNTIARASRVRARDEWFRASMAFCKRGLRSLRVPEPKINDLALQYMLLTSFRRREKTELEPLEYSTKSHRGTVETIRALQLLGVKVMGVTAQSVQVRTFTIEKLRKIGIEFWQPTEIERYRHEWLKLHPEKLRHGEWLKLHPDKLPSGRDRFKNAIDLSPTLDDAAPACCFAGSIFCGTNDKGSMVIEALNALHTTPQHVFFLDDSDVNVEKMAAVLSAQHIPAHCFKYRNNHSVDDGLCDLLLTGRLPHSLANLTNRIKALREQALTSPVATIKNGYTATGSATFECLERLKAEQMRKIEKQQKVLHTHPPSVQKPASYDAPKTTRATLTADWAGSEQRTEATDSGDDGIECLLSEPCRDKSPLIKTPKPPVASSATPRPSMRRARAGKQEITSPAPKPIPIPTKRITDPLQITGRRMASSAPSVMYPRPGTTEGGRRKRGAPTITPTVESKVQTIADTKSKAVRKKTVAALPEKLPDLNAISGKGVDAKRVLVAAGAQTSRNTPTVNRPTFALFAAIKRWWRENPDLGPMPKKIRDYLQWNGPAMPHDACTELHSPKKHAPVNPMSPASSSRCSQSRCSQEVLSPLAERKPYPMRVVRA